MDCQGVVKLVPLAAVRDRKVPSQRVDKELFAKLQKRIDKIEILLFSAKHGSIVRRLATDHVHGSRAVAPGTMSRLTRIIDPGKLGVSLPSET